MSFKDEHPSDVPNPPHLRGAVYHAAVERRGGHEYAGGPVEWEPASRDCPGCSLCRRRRATAAAETERSSQ